MNFIKCPKCHFEQPADTYCAQCGVNMSRVQRTWKDHLKRPEALTILSLLALFVSIAAFMKYRQSVGGPRLKDRLGAEAQFDSLRKTRAQLEPLQESQKAPDQTLELASDLSAPSETLESEVSEAVETTDSKELVPQNRTADRIESVPVQSTLLTVWAEFQPLGLNEIGASQPGLYPIEKISDRMRELKGTYRILQSGTHAVDTIQTSVLIELLGRSKVRIDLEKIKQQGNQAATHNLEMTIYSAIGDGRTPMRELPVVTGRIDDSSGLVLVLPANLPASPTASAQPGPQSRPVLALILTKKQPTVADGP